jgi:predicted GNAT family acetyltransferase
LLFLNGKQILQIIFLTAKHFIFTRKIYAGMSDIVVTNNTAQQQFEVHQDGHTAILIYRFYKDDIAFMHTEVPHALENHGIAAALAKYAFEWAKEHNRKVMVYCPYVASYLKRYPEYNDQVDKNYK